MLYNEDIGKMVRSGNFIGELMELHDDGTALIEAENGEFMRVNAEEARLSVLSDFVHPNMPAVKYHHCFKFDTHAPHYFGSGICTGQGLGNDGRVRRAPLFKFETRRCLTSTPHVKHIWKENDFLLECEGVQEKGEDVVSKEDISTPAILDGRQAYGDKIQNHVDQAQMINAYLSGRQVQPIDVPMIMILIKVHRLGKMPDYGDTYDDIEGYLSIARSIIGPDMIEATTAKEYAEIKARGSQIEGKTIDTWAAKVEAKPSGNPYANA